MGLCASKSDSSEKKNTPTKQPRPQLPEDTVLKILLVGDSGVGKTSIICRFADNTFTEQESSAIEVDFPSVRSACSISEMESDTRQKLKVIEADGSKLKLQVWDTAGQEKFRTITASYYRGAHGVIIVYDVTNKETFKNVKHWVKDVELYASENVNKAVVGNKVDLGAARQVSKQEGKAFADELRVPFFETSAKDGSGVSECFEKLGIAIRDRLLSSQTPV